MSNPWDQLEGEPDAAYNRFLTYLSMGPGRSVRKAFCIYHDKPIPKRIHEAHRGSWDRDCAHWQWVDRAHAYDRARLIEKTQHTMAKLMHSVDVIALKVIQELERTKPRGWKQAVEALKVVAAFIPTESAATAALECDDGRPPINLITPD